MKLTAISIFIGALIGMLLWITKVILFFREPKNKIEMMMMGAETTVNIIPPVIFIHYHRNICWCSMGMNYDR